MIINNHQIAHRNVVSKYYNFLPEEIDVAIKDFDSILEEQGYHTNGTMFFSIISDPTEEVMTAEIFLTIDEDHFINKTEEEMFFRSYFLVSPMVMTRVMDNFDEVSQVKYWEIINYIKRNRLKQQTPMFVEFKNSHSGRNYVEMSVGVK
ncbi:DUF5085 family protein [Virgibacillus sp. YIM 98842]|uniref:DUF5085 family protein n=1 Tax=Virgibacillus sp. YIM 98842 TaxID=2663533 RepID=UPI0013DCD63C|nr:DUF5085 family protein [Virgibacillus sp. YIM 98842]